MKINFEICINFLNMIFNRYVKQPCVKIVIREVTVLHFNAWKGV